MTSKKLTDLEIEAVSLVSNKARPVNSKAKITFVKAEKEVKGDLFMSMKNLFEKYMGKKTEVDKAETEIEKAEVPTVEFATKDEVSTLLKAIETLTEEVKTMKSSNDISGFVSDFSKAYQEDRNSFKVEIAEEIAKAKRANPPVSNQPSLEDLVKSFNHPDQLFRNGTQGNTVDRIIAEGVQKGTIKMVDEPKATNSFAEVFKQLAGKMV